MKVTTLGFRKEEFSKSCFQIKTVYQNVSFYKRFYSTFMGQIKSMYSKKNNEKITKLDNNVYIGQSPSSNDRLSFISSVICLQEENEKSSDYPVFKYILNIPTPDYTSPSIEQIVEALNFMKIHENQNVLIHCKAGIGRSAVISVAYIGKKYNMNLLDAHKYVSERRNISKLYIANIMNPQWKVLDSYLNNG